MRILCSILRLDTFQLPLSGSLTASVATFRVADLKAFNSLSRDHSSPSSIIDVLPCPKDFQLPLSGSHKHFANNKSGENALTFNSLSRDHRSFRHLLTHLEDPRLSTPSLGITRRYDLCCSPSERRTFQLPLSGSHHVTFVYPKPALKLPFNSLSRDHTMAASRDQRWQELPLSFNSLSRDHVPS